MRITVTIDDDVLAVAKVLAARRSCSLGSGLSELARHGFRSASPVQEDEDATVFAIPIDAATIANENVYRSLIDWP